MEGKLLLSKDHKSLDNDQVDFCSVKNASIPALKKCKFKSKTNPKECFEECSSTEK